MDDEPVVPMPKDDRPATPATPSAPTLRPGLPAPSILAQEQSKLLALCVDLHLAIEDMRRMVATLAKSAESLDTPSGQLAFISASSNALLLEVATTYRHLDTAYYLWVLQHTETASRVLNLTTGYTPTADWQPDAALAERVELVARETTR